MTYRLCYIDQPWAYFTSLEPFWLQDGHNWHLPSNKAGMPYDSEWNEETNRMEHVNIVKLAYDGPFQFCIEEQFSTPAEINESNGTWLVSLNHGHRIFAGIDILGFCSIVRDEGGRIFVDEQDIHIEYHNMHSPNAKVIAVTKIG